MILDSEPQRNLLLAILSEHTFAVPGKALTRVALEIQALTKAITEATLPEEEDDGEAHSQETETETEEA